MIQKVVHGSIVEPNYITSQLAWRTQKDFIWVTVNVLINSLSSLSIHSYYRHKLRGIRIVYFM